MGIPPFALAADQHKETVEMARSLERHLANIRHSLAAECGGLFFIDGTKLIFQSTNDWSKDVLGTVRNQLTQGWVAIKCM